MINYKTKYLFMIMLQEKQYQPEMHKVMRSYPH